MGGQRLPAEVRTQEPLMQISIFRIRPAGVILLFFFIGFVIAAQIGGRMLDRGGAKRPVVIGCALAAVFHADLDGGRPASWPSARSRSAGCGLDEEDRWTRIGYFDGLPAELVVEPQRTGVGGADG